MGGTEEGRCTDHGKGRRTHGKDKARSLIPFGLVKMCLFSVLFITTRQKGNLILQVFKEFIYCDSCVLLSIPVQKALSSWCQTAMTVSLAERASPAESPGAATCQGRAALWHEYKSDDCKYLFVNHLFTLFHPGQQSDCGMLGNWKKK